MRAEREKVSKEEKIDDARKTLIEGIKEMVKSKEEIEKCGKIHVKEPENNVHQKI